MWRIAVAGSADVLVGSFNVIADEDVGAPKNP
jgi:hypothetical protein